MDYLSNACVVESYPKRRDIFDACKDLIGRREMVCGGKGQTEITK